MPSKWVVGKDVIEKYCTSHVSFGKACFDGLLTAHCKADWGIIYDISNLERVPKYPPGGIDPIAYRQRGEAVQWPWESILGVKKLKNEIRYIKKRLSFAVTAWKAQNAYSIKSTNTTELIDLINTVLVPPYDLQLIGVNEKTWVNPYKDFYLSQLNNIIRDYVEQYHCISKQVIQRTEVPLLAYAEAYDRIADEVHDIQNMDAKIISFAWNYLMPNAYCWLIDGNIVEDKNLDGRLFYFDFDMFLRAEKLRCKNVRQKFYLQYAIDKYCYSLELMWFDEVEVNTWINNGTLSYEISSVGTKNQSLTCNKDTNEKMPMPKQPQNKPEVTQKEAARRLGVTERTIRNWDSGKTTPQGGYPGRNSLTSFLMFAEDYKAKKSLKKNARAMNRAVSGGDMNEYPEEADF